MKVANKNIRATALRDFWGEDYTDSLYLWHGAKHDMTLTELENCDVPTCEDLFSSQAEVQRGHDFCKSYYYGVLTQLARELNAVHGLEHDIRFWQIIFGYWLYRHISVVYDKYSCLSRIEVDSTSIKLLDEADYFVPQNHFEYLYCFTNDFGVQQLVSQYCRLYAEKDFSVVGHTFPYTDIINRPIRKSSLKSKLRQGISNFIAEPQVVLMDAYFSSSHKARMKRESAGKIGTLKLPEVPRSRHEVDMEVRSRICGTSCEHSFENYFMQTLRYCLPRDLLENFSDYYRVFRKDIRSRKYTHIVNENWISNMPAAIYVALASSENRCFVSPEHAAGTVFFKNYMKFIDFDVADVYLSTGWSMNRDNLVKGGFAAKDIKPYESDENKTTILFVAHTRLIYWQAFNETHATNATFVKRLRLAADFLELLAPNLRQRLEFRPRQSKYLWDVERMLELEARKIPIDRQEFAVSVAQARIVVIDHISTGLAEILLTKVPFLLLHDVKFIPLDEEMGEIFDGLISCGVVHTSARSAVTHLQGIYDSVDAWWRSEQVESAVSRLVNFYLSPASKTTDYFLSLVADDSGRSSRG